MTNENDPGRYLDNFDDLDLSNKIDRRVGVILLKHYYGTLMANIGRDYLDLSQTFKKKELWNQWNEITSRLSTIEQLNVPEEYDQIVPQLNKLRRETEHNVDLDPRSVNTSITLEEIRAQAPMWAEWLESTSQNYHSAWERLSPKEAIIELIRDSLHRGVLDYQIRFERFEREGNAYHDIANHNLKKLDSLEENTEDTISKELVELLYSALALRDDIEDLREREMKYESHMIDEMEARQELQQFHEDN